MFYDSFFLLSLMQFCSSLTAAPLSQSQISPYPQYISTPSSPLFIKIRSIVPRLPSILTVNKIKGSSNNQNSNMQNKSLELPLIYIPEQELIFYDEELDPYRLPLSQISSVDINEVERIVLEDLRKTHRLGFKVVSRYESFLFQEVLKKKRFFFQDIR